MPEWIQPVSVIEMRIATHHLAVDGLCVLLELLRESRRSAQPFSSSKLRKWGIQVRWSSRNWCGIARCGSVRRRWSRASVNRKEMGIADFAHDPLLNQLDILAGRDFDWSLLIVEPSVRMAVSFHQHMARAENV